MITQSLQMKETGNMDEIEKYNIIECIINSDVFEMPRKLHLIKAMFTVSENGQR